MKKIGILILLITSSTAFANNEGFQDELQLPKAHYSQAQKKIIVEVTPDEKDYEKLQQQEYIVETIKNEANKPVEVKEISVNNSEN